MKVLLVSQEYPPETARGGIGSQTFSKANGLTKLGHEVFVISRSIDDARHETLCEGVTVIRIPGLDNSIPEMTEVVQWITHSVVVASEIESLSKKINFDIIDFPEWAAEAYTYLLNRTAWNTIPTVIQLHGPLVMFAETMNWPDKKSSFYSVGTHMESTCVQLANAVYSSSDCSTKWIRSFYNPQKEHIPTIHLGVDTAKFIPQPVPKSNRPTIVFVGKIVPNKGVQELVEAASHLVKKFPDLQLRMIGRGEQNLIKQLQKKADELGAPHLLDFVGFLNKEELPMEFSRAHIFACPSWYEGGPGFVFLEAMACRLPVVGCSGSGVDEIVTTGINGMLVPPRNRKALQKVLDDILSNDILLQNMAAEALDYVIQNADNRYCLEKLEIFYKSVIKTNARQKGISDQYTVETL